MLDDLAKGAKLRAYSEQAATKGKDTASVLQGQRLSRVCCKRCRREAAQWERENAAGVANLKQTWDGMEPEGAFDLVPHCKLAKVYDPAPSRLELVISVAQHREHIRGALGQTGTNRLLGQAELWNGHCQQRSMLRKTQHVKCILTATSDGWQACLHGIRSRRRAVTDQRWTLCLLLLTPSEHE